MPDKNDRINELLDKYVHKTIGEDDFIELFQYISKDEYKHVLDDYMKYSDKLTLPDADVHHVDWQHMYNNIVDKKEKSRTAIVIDFAKKITIAASLVAVGYIAYHTYLGKSMQQTTGKTVKADLAPGGNKAILKLGDGTEIILNDAQNGGLSQQGSSVINKENEGLISYAANERKETRVFTNVLTTPRGGQYRLELPDHSQVWLNAESSITFPTAFTGQYRKVSVTGEVYFEVSKDKSKPFMVENQNTTIEVLGTHFNVNVYPNEVQSAVTLLEGSVRLKNNHSSRILQPGQQAVFEANGSQIQLRNVDTENVVDWKNGLFIFEDASITEVMRQVERWYDVDVKYVGKVPAIKFNGIVSRNNNVSKLLKFLRAAGNIEFNINNKTIEVKTNQQAKMK
ncbi:FecR family protein [Pedobacter frigidisoli]|uniref:FecR family protein n=1 Tax=Pedobacter frigidisoli TaxID=2530455 RepID=UPI00292D07A9|nr:FecR domain-containing protein [Pedobacter frigidisoli]